MSNFPGSYNIYDDPSARIAREMLDSPSARIAREMLDSPSARIAREMLDSPSARIAREMLDSPSARIAREMLDSPSARIAREMLDSPSARIAREMLDSPSARIAREMLDSPSARIAREMLDSPSARIAREMLDSPSARIAREMLDSPSARIAREMLDSPSARIAREMLDSPSARIAREMLDNQSARIAQEVLGSLSGVVLGNPSTQKAYDLMTGRVGELTSAMLGDPLALTSSFLAGKIVNKPRAAGDITAVVGHSLMLDALASIDFEPEMSEIDFVAASASLVERITEAIKKYYTTAQTLPALFGLNQQVILLLATIISTYAAVLSVYYASQSATSSDIAGLKGAVERQTDLMQNQKLTVQFETKFADLLTLANRLTEERRDQISSRPIYMAQRSIPAKAARNMRSHTVGTVAAGTIVAVHQFDGKWIEVDFFDFSEGHSSRGWVTKKNFKREK